MTLFANLSLHMVELLFVAGIGGGILSSLVGGAGMITYPALIAAGLPPLTATACNLTASSPGTLIAALSDFRQLPPFNRSFVLMLLATIVGSGIGAGLLMVTPQGVFALLVPVLLGVSTILFAYAQPIGDWVRARAEAQGRTIDLGMTNLKMLLPVAVYGGYFGAGVGIIILAITTVATKGDYRSANVAKNLIGSMSSATAATIFIAKGAVLWPPTIAMMLGTVIGGLIGATLARVVPRGTMRTVVVVIGVMLTVYFAWHYWF